MLESVVSAKAQRKKLCQRRVAVKSLVQVYLSHLLGQDVKSEDGATGAELCCRKMLELWFSTHKVLKSSDCIYFKPYPKLGSR